MLDFTKHYSRHMIIQRLDIALDCNVPIPDLYNNKHTQFVKKELFINHDVMTGFYLGNRKGNKKHLIRCYDKKLDSTGKNKFHIFSTYFHHDVVSRIEVELHCLTLRAMGISPQVIIDHEEARQTGFISAPNCLEQYFASLCLDKQGTCFHILEDVSFKNVERLKTTITAKKGDAIVDELMYVKQFVTRAENLQKMRIDPIELLQRRLPPMTVGLNQQGSSRPHP